MVVLPAVRLRAFTEQIFLHCGLASVASSRAADAVAYADKCGLSSYGVAAVVNKYVPRLRSGRINPRAQVRIVSDHSATALIDGDGGLGIVTMAEAVDRVRGKAATYGLGVVSVRNSTHFGAAGHHATSLAAKGFIGIVMTNCGPTGMVPPLGGAVRMLGTNPLSVAIPAPGLAPFVLDMSTTTVAANRLKSENDVPSGWLVNPNGDTVTEPAAYHAGVADLTWLGGHPETGAAKGYGLSLAVELLCRMLGGPVTGAGEDIAHLVLAIDPSAFGDPDAIVARAGDFLQRIIGCPLAPCATEVTYPGARTAARMKAANAYGVVVPADVGERLRALASELGVPLPAELRTA